MSIMKICKDDNHDICGTSDKIELEKQEKPTPKRGF